MLLSTRWCRRPRFTQPGCLRTVLCGQRLAGACSSASLCSSCPLVGGSQAAIHRSHLRVSAPGQTQSPPSPHELLQPPSCRGRYVARAVPCRTSSEAPATGLVERASRCAVPLVRWRASHDQQESIDREKSSQSYKKHKTPGPTAAKRGTLTDKHEHEARRFIAPRAINRCDPHNNPP